ncbi:CheY-like chemotaxis protein [Rhizobium sp. BK529]|uniref:response regulator n=1 Tax=Rhizobium sp. BK529 TaxID=2586983 RepID=UPI001609DD32|nr:response regulator [Rhizobium sp. BK529]MBB3595924.1 CheY-like chemotaxis protein [Rhizobium sp. BK529]
MSSNRDQWIAARAYHLWEDAGKPVGQHENHWHQAVLERDLLERTQASTDGHEVLERSMRARPDPGPRSVLVVEDELQLRGVIVDFFNQAGYRTLEAANADEALVLLKNNPIDTLYADVDMPGSMDGLGLVASVRSQWPSMRLIVTSGIVKLSHKDEDASVTFVSKPTAGQQLLKLMA